ncbi:MAG: adenylate/guanylate cyclase domain-containing protein [Gammaproteobacteria bacterium]|nr:adenylate/guanylate cyclase domain-containing protein [Gammaproteobacteria bacterium]
MTRKIINCVVMFADVAGSTAMYENMGDDMARERISKSLDRLIAITKRYNGILVKTIGDEILVYFTDVDMAVYAARSIQEVMEDDRSPDYIGVSIRTGMQYGSTILEDDDIFGDTVNVAARIASMAGARQILCTKELYFKIKNPDLASNMRPFDRLRVKGRKEQLDVYLFHWEDDGDITNMATASSFTNPARYDLTQSLKLSYKSDQYSLNTDTTSFLLGRDNGCEMVVNGDLISRYHAKIEHRRGKFILTDQSTNGTFVTTQEGQEVFLRREELTLFGAGFISFGRKVDRNDENMIRFFCE